MVRTPAIVSPIMRRCALCLISRHADGNSGASNADVERWRATYVNRVAMPVAGKKRDDRTPPAHGKHRGRRHFRQPPPGDI